MAIYNNGNFPDSIFTQHYLNLLKLSKTLKFCQWQYFTKSGHTDREVNMVGQKRKDDYTKSCVSVNLSTLLATLTFPDECNFKIGRPLDSVRIC